MPIFEVTDPSGRKYRVEGPEGSTADEALAQVQAQSAPAASPVSPPDSIQTQPLTPGAESVDLPITRIQPRAQAFGVAGGTGPLPAPLAGTVGMGVDRPEQGEFMRGVNAGIDNLQGTLYGLAGLVGESVGNKKLQDWGLEGYQRNQEEAEAVGPRVQSLAEIEDIGDFFDAAAGWMGSTTAFMATSLVGGGVGGVVGRSVAKSAVARLVGKGVTKEAAEAAVQRALADPVKRKLMVKAMKTGALGGSGVASALTQQGDLYGQLKQAGIEDAAAPAWGFGALQGALDVIPEAMVLKKLLPDQVEAELKKTFARGLAGTVAQQSAVEGLTEGAQQTLGSLARIQSGGADWNDVDTQGVLDSMAAGAVVGSIMGGGSETLSRITQRPEQKTTPASDSVELDMDRSKPVFDDASLAEARTKDWQQATPESVQAMDPGDRLDYLQWLHKEATPDNRIAYEQFRKQPPAKGELDELIGLFSSSAAAAVNKIHAKSEQNVRQGAATVVIGKDGIMDGEIDRDGVARRTAGGYATASRADQYAARLALNDNDADYSVHFLNAPAVMKMGLKGNPGYYIMAKPKPDAELMNLQGRKITRHMARRQGLGAAKEAWNALPKALKDGSSQYTYGMEFVRKEGDKTSIETMDTRELVKMGLDLEPTLMEAPQSERLVRAMRVAIAELMQPDGGVSYTPVGATADGKLQGKRNTVLWQPKNSNPVTLDVAQKRYGRLQEKDMTSATQNTPTNDMPYEDRPVEEDQLNVSDAIPVFERGTVLQGREDNVDTSTILETEGIQANRSQGTNDPSVRGLAPPNPALNDKVVPIRQTEHRVENMDQFSDADIVARREAKEAANVTGELKTPEQVLEHMRASVKNAEAGKPQFINVSGETFPGMRPTAAQKLEARGLIARYQAAKRGFIASDDGAAVTVTGSPDAEIDTKIQGLVQSIKNMLGIKGEIHVAREINGYADIVAKKGFTTAADQARTHVEQRTKLGIKINGFMQTLPDGTTMVFLPKGMSQAQTIKSLMHEIGHAFFRQKFQEASIETQNALRADFEKGKEEYAKKRNNTEKLTEEELFQEWMSDQLAAWVASDEAPKSLVEKWLADIVVSFQKIWDAVTKVWPPEQSFKQFVKEVTKSTVLPDRSGDTLGAQASMVSGPTTKSLGLKAQIEKLGKNPTISSIVDNTVGLAGAARRSMFRSIQARIRLMKIPAFDTIINFFDHRPGQVGGYDFDTEYKSRMGAFRHEYNKIVEGLTDEQRTQLHQELLLERDLSNIAQPKLRERARQYRDFMQKLYRYQRNSHLPIRLVQDYFPMVGDREQLAAPDAAQSIKDALAVNGITATDEQITDFIRSMIDDHYVADFDPKTIEDVDANYKNPFVQAMRTRTLPKEWRDAIRGIKDQNGRSRFYSKDMGEVMYRYMNQAVRRAEYNKRLGDVDWDSDVKNPPVLQADGSETVRPYDPHFKLKQLLNVGKQQGATLDQQAFMFEALSGLMGTHGRIKSEYLRKANNAMLAYQNVRTMSMVLFASLPDLANMFITRGNWLASLNSMVGGFKEAWKSSAEQDAMLRTIGHANDTSDQLMLFDVSNFWNSPGNMSEKVNNTFFRAIGMHRWTNFMRGLALRVSVDYINRHAQGAAGDSAARLTELGVTAADIGTWNALRQPGFGQPGFTMEDIQATAEENKRRATLNLPPLESITPEQLESVQKVSGALARLVTEMVVNAKPAERPMFGNSEQGRIFFQFKSFMYGYTNRILARIWHDLSKDGSTTMDKATVAVGMAFSLSLAALGMELKDWLQNGLWGRESKLDEKSGFGYMTTVLNRSGALGVASMALDAGEAGANGRAPLVALAGPTISQTNDLVQYGLYHAAAGAVPVLSSFPGARDGIKELLGTEDE